MKITTILLCGTCAFALSACGNYVLPDRQQLDRASILRLFDGPAEDTTTEPVAPASVASVPSDDTVPAPVAVASAAPVSAAAQPAPVSVAAPAPVAVAAQDEPAPVAVAMAEPAPVAEPVPVAAPAPVSTPAPVVAAVEPVQSSAPVISPAEAPVLDGMAGPANPLPGRCYAQATRPAKFETRIEQVLEQEAAEQIEVIPATYKTVSEPVVVEEAYTKVRVVPAVYKTVMETVIVEPAKQRTVNVPAEYKTVSEQVAVQPGYRVWKSSGKIYPTGAQALGGVVLGNRTTSSGEILSLIDVAPVFETVEKQVLVAPATTRIETIPAVTKQVPKRVVSAPAYTTEIVVPAKTDLVEKRVIATPERTVTTTVPAKYRDVEKRVETVPAQTVWAEVFCDTQMTADLTTQVQTKLKSLGFYKGAVDGVSGPGTRSAIRAYQLKQGLDSDVLTLQNARALGINA